MRTNLHAVALTVDHSRKIAPVLNIRIRAKEVAAEIATSREMRAQIL
jgi:hypothetical protein